MRCPARRLIRTWSHLESEVPPCVVEGPWSSPLPSPLSPVLVGLISLTLLSPSWGGPGGEKGDPVKPATTAGATTPATPAGPPAPRILRIRVSLPDGTEAVHVIIPHRRNAAALERAPEPYNPWYVLGPVAYFAPSQTPPPLTFGPLSTYLTGTWLPWIGSPYGFTATPAPTSQNNPNRPAVNPAHPNLNVARHWAATDVPIPVTIRIPAAQSQVTTLLVHNALPGYFWQNFINDVTAAFNYYANIPTANVSLSITTDFNGGPYGWDTVSFPQGPPLPQPPATGTAPVGLPAALQSEGVLIWDNRPSSGGNDGYQGPTGNGQNDVIMLSFTNFANDAIVNNVGGFGGLTSMLVNPQTGQIIEADVILDAASFVTLPPPTLFPFSPHPGPLLHTLPPGPVLAPPPYVPTDTTSFLHEIGHFFGLGHTNLIAGNFAVGPQPAYTNPQPTAGFPASLAVSYTGLNLNSINQAPGFSRYPAWPAMVGAIVPQNGSQYLTFMASLPDAHPDDAALLSMLHPVTTIGGGKLPLINTTAVIKGRLIKTIGIGTYSASAFAVPNIAGPGTLTAGQPPVAALTGFYRESPSDVVGLADAVTGAPCSGVFVLQGVPAPTAQVPVACGHCPVGNLYDVVFEPPECVGIPAGGVGYIEEWVQEQLWNPSGNIWPNNQFQTAVLCNALGYLEVVPGSVIDLGPVVHDGTLAPRNISRPLVSIYPRTFRAGPDQPMFVAARSTVAIDAGASSISVNGRSKSLEPYMTGTQSCAGGTVLTCWTLPASMVPSSGPVTVQVTIIEDQYLISQLPGGVSTVSGVNVVRY